MPGVITTGVSVRMSVRTAARRALNVECPLVNGHENADTQRSHRQAQE